MLLENVHQSHNISLLGKPQDGTWSSHERPPKQCLNIVDQRLTNNMGMVFTVMQISLQKFYLFDLAIIGFICGIVASFLNTQNAQVSNKMNKREKVSRISFWTHLWIASLFPRDKQSVSSGYSWIFKHEMIRF